MSIAKQPSCFFAPPRREVVERFLRAQAGAAVSYREVGESRDGTPAGYNLDHNRVRIGQGSAAFEQGCAALRAWRMFPAPWTRIAPEHAPIQEGQVVAMQAHALGLWWLNACRIVYVIDEKGGTRPLDAPDEPAGIKGNSGGPGGPALPAEGFLDALQVVDEATPMRRFGFAYGTLPAHVEQGEERFSVEQRADGSVWYDLRAFSRPRCWPVRLARPLARRLQRRFVRDSQRAMIAAVCEEDRE